LSASDSKVKLNEMEKIIVGSLLAFGVRSSKAMSWLLSEGHQLLGLDTRIQETQINHHVSNLMEKGIIVQKKVHDEVILIPTPFGLNIAIEMLEDLTDNIEQLQNNIYRNITDLNNQVQASFSNLDGEIIKIWEERSHPVSTSVTAAREKLINTNETLLTQLVIDEDDKNKELDSSNAKEKISEIIIGLHAQIDESIQAMENISQRTSSETPSGENELRELVEKRISHIVEDYAQTRTNLQDQVQQLSSQIEILTRIDSSLDTVCIALERAAAQVIDNYKGEIENKISSYTEGVELELSNLEKFSEPVKNTSATITKTNSIATNSLELVSDDIETFFETLKERHSTISTLTENLLATQQDLQITPEELMRDLKETENLLSHTLERVNSALGDTLNPVTSMLKRNYQELTTQTQETLKQLEAFQQEVLKNWKLLETEFISEANFNGLRMKIQNIITPTPQKVESEGMIPEEDFDLISETLHNAIERTKNCFEDVSEDFITQNFTIFETLYEKLREQLNSALTTPLEVIPEKDLDLTDQFDEIDAELKAELDNSIIAIETITNQTSDQIHSEIANRLEDSHKDSIRELEKIVGVQKGLFSIYSKGLKAALTRYNEFSSELLDELKDLLNENCQQLTNDTNQTLNEFDVDTYLQFLEEKIRIALTELGVRIISRSTEQFMRTLENLEDITHKTSNTVSNTAESFKDIFSRVLEDVTTNLSDIEKEFQDVKMRLLDAVSSSLLAQRNEFAQLAVNARTQLEERIDRDDQTISTVVMGTRESIIKTLQEGLEPIWKGAEETTSTLVTAGKTIYDRITDTLTNLANLIETKMTRILQATSQKIEGFEVESLELIEGLLNKQNASFAETMKITERELDTDKSNLFERLSKFKETMQEFLEENHKIIDHTIQMVTETLKTGLAPLQIEFPGLFSAVQFEVKKQTEDFIPKIAEDQQLILEFMERIFERLEERQSELIGQATQIIHTEATQFTEQVREFRQLIESRAAKIFGRKQEGYDDYINKLDNLMNNIQRLEANVSSSLPVVVENLSKNKEMILERGRLAFEQQYKSSTGIFSDFLEAITRIDLAFKENLTQILNKSQLQATNVLTTSLKRQADQNERLVREFSVNLSENIANQQRIVDKAENVIREVGGLYNQISDEIRFGFQDKLAQHTKEAGEIYQASTLPLIDDLKQDLWILKTQIENDLDKIETTLDTLSGKNTATNQTELEKIRDKTTVELDHMTSEVTRTLDEAMKIIFGTLDTFQGNVEEGVSQTNSNVGTILEDLFQEQTKIVIEAKDTISTHLNQTINIEYINIVQAAEQIEDSISELKSQLNQFTKEVENIHAGEDTNTLEVVKQLQLEIETRLREKMNTITSQISEVVVKVNSRLNTTITTLRSRIEDVSANQLTSIDTVEQESLETLLNNIDPIVDQLKKTRSVLVEGMTQSLNDLTETLQKLLQETVTTHETTLIENTSKIKRSLETIHDQEKSNESTINNMNNILKEFKRQIEINFTQGRDLLTQKLESRMKDIRTELDEQQDRVNIKYTEKLDDTETILSDTHKKVIQTVESFLNTIQTETNTLLVEQSRNIEDKGTQLIHATQSLEEAIRKTSKEQENTIKDVEKSLRIKNENILVDQMKELIITLSQRKLALQSFNQQYNEVIAAVFQAIAENTEVSNQAAEEAVAKILPRINEIKMHLQNNQTDANNLVTQLNVFFDHNSHAFESTKVYDRIKADINSIDFDLKYFNELMTVQFQTNITEAVSPVKNQIKESRRTLNQVIENHTNILDKLNELSELVGIGSSGIDPGNQDVPKFVEQLTKIGEALKEKLNEENQSIAEAIDQIQKEYKEVIAQKAQKIQEIKHKLEEINKNLIAEFTTLSNSAEEVVNLTSKHLKDHTHMIKSQIITDFEKMVENSNKKFVSYQNIVVEAKKDIETVLQEVEEIETLVMELLKSE